ncbi:MAG TPA: HAMP domain-containing sensor histidine kinase [Nitrospirota bacterium]|nr:HAMP domain-containing sensor histidine kinase [Nitrospirota bacterium]
MTTGLIDKLKQVSPWHFIWISIVSSEVITLVLSFAQGRVWWGGVSRETLIIGAVDALVVPLIVASVVIYSVKRTAELQRVNEQLQEANRKLQEIDQLKSDFISVVSHELRTPLTTIKAFNELLIMKPGMAQQRKDKLMGSIKIESDRLTRLINDLLDLARIESGDLLWRIEEIAVDDIIQGSIESMGPLFENKVLQVTSSISPLLPTVTGDRDRLVQVVTNILSNAVKFTPAGGLIHVTAREERAPLSQIVVEISDNGVGIGAADLELIFEKFQRSGDRFVNTVEGSGLGLAIARQIVEHHGGRIWATSAYGKGSIFSFTLPIGPRGDRSFSARR